MVKYVRSPDSQYLCLPVLFLVSVFDAGVECFRAVIDASDRLHELGLREYTRLNSK
jgi:hypothetical protein